MSAFHDYYMVEVERELGRKATQAETDEAKRLYVQGWHPSRTAEHLQIDPHSPLVNPAYAIPSEPSNAF
jgi:hypothetical protein